MKVKGFHPYRLQSATFAVWKGWSIHPTRTRLYEEWPNHDLCKVESNTSQTVWLFWFSQLHSQSKVTKIDILGDLGVEDSARPVHVNIYISYILANDDLYIYVSCSHHLISVKTTIPRVVCIPFPHLKGTSSKVSKRWRTKITPSKPNKAGRWHLIIFWETNEKQI